jgi:hypothetical protein
MISWMGMNKWILFKKNEEPYSRKINTIHIIISILCHPSILFHPFLLKNEIHNNRIGNTLNVIGKMVGI